MAAPHEKLAQSLQELQNIQNRGKVAISTGDISRTHRERLMSSGFLKEVMKGWYIASRPNEPIGESTSWYASFWQFCRDYLNYRFNEEWCLSPEQSISLHAENWTVPKQLLVRSPRGGNKPINLLFETSIFDIRSDTLEKHEIELKEGLRIVPLSAALKNCSTNNFISNPIDMRSALLMITDETELLRHLLNGNHTTIAGKLAGAFRNVGKEKFANNIITTFRSIGHSINETDPFENKLKLKFSRETSPYVNRLKMMWEKYRQPIIDNFPINAIVVKNHKEYLNDIDDIYVTDAYHSLSIEGYKVSKELIEQVSTGSWDPVNIKKDQEQKDALAARGYWLAFQAIRKSITKVLNGKNSGSITKEDHHIWFKALFEPSVTAGIIKAGALAGYRNQPVYIRRSKHTPPNIEGVRDLMPAFFKLLMKEENPAIRIILGHFIFVYIHPYIDGNGRIGRFLMNLMVASAGLPWIIVPLERRNEYMNSLEVASVQQNIVPFTKFIASLVK